MDDEGEEVLEDWRVVVWAGERVAMAGELVREMSYDDSKKKK